MNTDNQAKSQKFNLKKILIVLVIAIVLIIGIIVSFTIAGRPYDRTNNQYTAVKIKENYSIEEVAATLHKKKIIGDESKFVTLSNLIMHGKSYKAGTYYLSPSMSFSEISSTITNGITTKEGFTIPSGYTVEQTAAALEQAGVCDSDEFLAIAADEDLTAFDFIDKDVDGSAKLEGFLFPTEYEINPDANAAMVVINMLNEFDNNFTDEYRARAEELGLSIREVVIIASIIEKTTTVDSEKAEISAVIHNKLNLDMKFDGGYPDSPLCSPGIKSIVAALYPSDSENIYYVLSDKLDGTHIFTSDEDEYNELLKAYELAVEKKSAEEQPEEE